MDLNALGTMAKAAAHPGSVTDNMVGGRIGGAVALRHQAGRARTRREANTFASTI
jgi:hypothetical protein